MKAQNAHYRLYPYPSLAPYLYSFFPDLLILTVMIAFTALAGLIGCQSSDGGGGRNSAATPTPSWAEVSGSSCITSSANSIEESYCSQIQTYSNGVNIKGQALFNAREISEGGLEQVLTNQPVRRAEVQVLKVNSDGSTKVVQCGETDDSGNLQLRLPVPSSDQGTVSYSLRVNSRADNTYMKASVLDKPLTRNYYCLSSSFSLSSSDAPESTRTVTLPVGNVSEEGGAFFILDKIYETNDYLRSHTSSFSDVASFTVAPKISVFWNKGLSPAAYYNEPQTGLSFFNKSDDEVIPRGLYILGGIQGDSTCVDTDTFDRSVIIHEYGHFLEDTYAKSDTPGGSHNGNSMLDPRLAWSEGWADFIQAAVLGEGVYRDSVGNADCPAGTMLAIDIDLDQASMDVPTYADEGIFREISVSRALWKTRNLNSVGMPYLWRTFASSTKGLKNTDLHFRNMGMFNELLYGLISDDVPSALSGYATILSGEKQPHSKVSYGLPLTPQSGSSCTFSFASGGPVADSPSYLYTKNTNLLRTNDFYSFYYDGSAANSSLILKYGKNAPSGSGGVSSSVPPYDLDLLLWEESYSMDQDSTLMGISESSYPESTSGVSLGQSLPGGGVTSGSETVSLSRLPPGYYMIQVYANYVSSAVDTSYYLENQSGVRICPQP